MKSNMKTVMDMDMKMDTGNETDLDMDAGWA